MDELEITSDGRTVWVNGANGAVGRFSRRGVDVHNRHNNGCLHCVKGPCGMAEWERFKVDMWIHHGSIVTDQYMPEYLVEA